MTIDALPTRTEGWLRLFAVVDELGARHRELFAVLQEELRAKVDARAESPETSLTARENDATASAIDYTVHVFEVKGVIAALTEERDFLYAYLDRIDDRAED